MSGVCWWCRLPIPEAETHEVRSFEGIVRVVKIPPSGPAPRDHLHQVDPPTPDELAAAGADLLFEIQRMSYDL